MSQERVMLLIDADNLSVDVMEQAIRLLLNQHGGLHVRRAYCTAESAVANQSAFKRLGIKPMVNLAAGKNSTDIAMAVDAIDLVLAERPDVVVIASSDSDFAPLVQRLREKGCVVRGIGQKGKVGDETQDVYDDYTVIEHRGGAAARPSSRAPARAGRPAERAPRASRARPAVPAPADAAAPLAPTKTAPAGRPARGRSLAPAPQLLDDAPVPTEADTSAIFGDIVGGALDADEAPAVQTTMVEGGVDLPAPAPAKAAGKLAAKPRSRARKTSSSAAAAPAPAADGKTTTGTEAPAATAPPSAPAVAEAPAEPAAAPVAAAPRARGRKAKPAAQAAAEAEAAPDGLALQATAPPVAASPAPAAAPAPADDSTTSAAPARATLAAVMACLPELARGQSIALNVAVQRLREARLLGKNSSSLKLFSQFSDSLDLLPARNPSRVQLRG